MYNKNKLYQNLTSSVGIQSKHMAGPNVVYKNTYNFSTNSTDQAKYKETEYCGLHDIILLNYIYN